MKYTNSGQFKRGQSGNPSGREAGSKNDFFNVKARLEQSGFDLIGSLIEMAENDKYDDKLKFKARSILLDRVAPALRAVEFTGQLGTLFNLQIQHPTGLDAVHPDKQSLQSESDD